MTDDLALRSPGTGLRTWLLLVAVFLLLVVLVGGATRLTDSGLSITEWKPIMGALPPLTAADWDDAFSKYRQIPEYLIQNRGMSLEEFKVIFWWEWGHRFLARFIGVLFAVPLLYFAIRGRITRKLWPRLLLLLALGAAQGGLGWFMVYSGLSERVDVSQYRLAAHLTLAAVIFASLIWVGLGIGRTRERPQDAAGLSSVLLIFFILFQICAGGFVAGIDAGMGYNTWPLMDGAWIPSGLAPIEPLWRNFFENALTVQFQHRMIAYALFLFALWHAWSSFSLSTFVVVYLMLAQIAIGVLTVLLRVPMSLALLHQAMAFVALGAAVWNAHRHLVMPLPDPDQP